MSLLGLPESERGSKDKNLLSQDLEARNMRQGWFLLRDWKKNVLRAFPPVFSGFLAISVIPMAFTSV